MTALGPSVTTTLAEAIRDSGTKDAHAQPIIDSLVKLGVELRKSSPERAAHTPDEVQGILTDELKKATEKAAKANGSVINPLINMDGESSQLFLNDSINVF